MWVLLWVYLSYAGNLTTRIQYAAVKDVVMSSHAECERALSIQLEVNDTRYMIAHDDARLLCVEIPPK